MASRHQPAPLLIAVLVAVCAVAVLYACDNVVTIVPSLKDGVADADASVDVVVDEDNEVAVDPVEDEEPDATYEFNTCLGACALQKHCFPLYGLPRLDEDVCGAMCARLSSESRRCLDDAAETFDCTAFMDCQGELDFECITICEFVWPRCDPNPLCFYYCPMYNAAPRECAFTAAASRDCVSTVDCLVGHSYGATCHDACTMLIETCGVDADFESCMGLCDFPDIGSMSRACIDAAEYYRDCEALAACGGIVP
jgi:hypothetical protein